MTDTKPEALRLADELLFAGRFAYETENGAARRRIARNFKAAAELRRLHEVNAELLEALKALIDKVRVESWNEKVYYQAALAISKATGELK
jgi:bifunctional DNase/RNase